jgi:hypothetical protein
MILREIIIYSENQIKPIHIFCGQNAEIVNVKEGGVRTEKN